MKKNRKGWVCAALLLLVLALAGFPAGASEPGPGPETETSTSTIRLTTGELTLSVGETYRLRLDGLTGQETVTWKSKSKSIARVSRKGKVVAKKQGATEIYAYVDGVPYCCSVTVAQPVVNIRLNQETIDLIQGQIFRLKASVEPAGAATPEIVWKSSNKKIARVSVKGKVRGVSRGTAVITAGSADGSAVEASCTVTVGLPAPGLNMTQMTLEAGKSAKLTVVDDSGDSTYVWSTSDKSVATVTNGKVKGKSAGQAVIVAMRREDGKSASCYVTVTETAQEPEPGSSSQPSAVAKKFLKKLEKYSNQVKEDKAAGIRWEYDNNKAQNTWPKAYSASRKNGVTYVNCALLARWGLRELGLLDTTNFWGEVGGDYIYRGNSKEQLLEHCEIIPVYKTPDELLAEGNLLPGDICSYVTYGHTNVYAGDGLWYDGGRSGQTGSYVGGAYVFDSFGPAATVNMSATKIGTIIRLVR